MTSDDDKDMSSAETQKAEMSQAITGRRILVVDDDEMIRDLFGRVLANAQYEVRVASNGKQAMVLAEQLRPDLVITDLVMPEQEGMETIRAFRRSYPNLKIIAISGAFDGNFLGVAKVLGAQIALLKPVSPKELLGAVHQVLG
jgi:DNA-binding response OmpR family regulator